MHVRWTVLALLMSLVVAGCVAWSDGPSYVSPRAASATASEAGSGSLALRILVTAEPGGPPLPGVVVTVSQSGGTGADDTVAVRTGSDGRAVARVDRDDAASLGAWAPGWTEERRYRFLPDATSEVVVPLFREHLALDMEGALGPAAVSTREVDGRDFKWDPKELSLGERGGVTPDYLRRLVKVRAALEWTNGPTGGGDLGIAAGRAPDAIDAVHDGRSAQAAPGPHDERVTVGFDAIYGAGWREAQRVFVGAGTGRALVAPLGLPYQLEVEAWFDGDLSLRPTPGPTVAAIVALAIVALAMPRARRG